MSAEKLEYAELSRLVSGFVDQEPRPTWEDIRNWSLLEKSHAVANLIVTTYLGIRWDLDLKAQQLIDNKLAQLQNDGWDGATLEEFIQDFGEIKLKLGEILDPETWKKYFTGTDQI